MSAIKPVAKNPRVPKALQYPRDRYDAPIAVDRRLLEMALEVRTATRRVSTLRDFTLNLAVARIRPLIINGPKNGSNSN